MLDTSNGVVRWLKTLQLSLLNSGPTQVALAKTGSRARHVSTPVVLAIPTTACLVTTSCSVRREHGE